MPSSPTTGKGVLLALGDDLEHLLGTKSPGATDRDHPVRVHHLAHREPFEHVDLELADVSRRVDPAGHLGLVDADAPGQQERHRRHQHHRHQQRVRSAHLGDHDQRGDRDLGDARQRTRPCPPGRRPRRAAPRPERPCADQRWRTPRRSTPPITSDGANTPPEPPDEMVHEVATILAGNQQQQDAAAAAARRASAAASRSRHPSPAASQSAIRATIRIRRWPA